MKNKNNLKTIAGSCLILAFAILASCKKSETPKEEKIPGYQIIHELLIEGHPMQVLEKESRYFMGNDIILTSEQFAIMKKMANANTTASERSAIVKKLKSRWTDGIVYYKLKLGDDNRFAEQAMKEIAAKTPIRFVERKKEANFVVFVKSGSNASNLGMIGGKQTIELYNSNHKGIIIHEILHALGVEHEQSRPDRNKAIIIHYENMSKEYHHNFSVNSAYKGVGNFDFESIMLYGPYDFSNNGKPTITKLDGSVYTIQEDRLSKGDIAGLNKLYKQ